MAALSPTSQLDTEIRMRSGAAARLAGISASTLRIWEFRYGVVLPPKSVSGQRTYTMMDIERLQIIKRLTAKGHLISSLAHLDINTLLALFTKSKAPSSDLQKVCVVGLAAARKLEGRFKLDPALVFDDLDHLERSLANIRTLDALVIHLRTLHPDLLPRIKSLRNNLTVKNFIVVYSFAPELVTDSLRSSGITLRRAPFSGNELLGLIVKEPSINENFDSGNLSTIRHYSDSDLVAISEMPSLVSCECTRHLAEIVTLLVEFEQYSTECNSQDSKDVVLHQTVFELTSQARAVMEKALNMVVIKESLSHLLSK
jgi:DNA-binding transcriptional MerR regulator